MKKRAFFVFNPRAGKGQIRLRLMEIVDILVKGGYEVILHPTQEVRDAKEQVMQYAPLVDLVVCSGGDGTLDEVVSGLIECHSRTPVGYIPAGSTNDFASSLGLPKSMLKAAKAIVDGELYQCDIGRMNERTFVYIAAFGLFTDVSYGTAQDIKNVLGHVAYVLEGMKRLFDIKSYFMVVQTGDGKIYEGDFIYGMITNSRSVGGFKHLTGKNVDMADGLFEVTLIRMPKNPLELQEILSALLVKEDTTDMVETFKTGKLTIHAKESIPWTLDGEFGGDQQYIEIASLRQALQIYVQKKTKDGRSLSEEQKNE